MSEQENASGAQVPCISLLACPFCGKAPTLKKTVGGFFKLDHRDTLGHGKLHECPVKGEMSPHDGSGYPVHATPEQLAAWWNTRQPNTVIGS